METIILTLVVAMWPGVVFAAEGEQPEGSWSALIFYAINFVLFLGIVQRYGWPAIAVFFRERAKTIRQTRDRAEKAYQDAQKLAGRAAQLLRQLEADKQTLMTELNQETDYQVKQLNEAARDAVTRIRRDAEITKVALHEGAQRHLRETMADGAGRIARELVARNFRPSDQARLLGSFVDRIGEEARP